MEIRDAIEALRYDADREVALIAHHVHDLFAVAAAPGRWSRYDFERYVDQATAPGTYRQACASLASKTEDREGREATEAELREDVAIVAGVHRAARGAVSAGLTPEAVQAVRDRFRAKVHALIKLPAGAN